MKKALGILLTALLTIGLAACSTVAPQESTETPEQSVSIKASPTPEAVDTPSPEPKQYAPEDIFGSELNPYGDTVFPGNFHIFAASFSQGSAKLGGKVPYSLSMTAEGNTDDAIAFLAALAGLSEDEKVSRTDEYNGGGFCEFQGKNGAVFTIRKTNPDDDRYAYVDGCLIDITSDVNTADIEKYISLARDNYNLNALSSIAQYLDTEPDWGECSFDVNLHKKEARASVVYHVSDVEAVQQVIADNAKSDWYDTQSGSMGLSYGMIGIKIEFDSKGGAVYITQSAAEFDTALCEYIAPEISLTKLGFGFGQDGVCGVYEQHDPHYMSVAIHRPEWGEFSDDWNIEFMDVVNGYQLRITYNAAENKYHISADKNKKGAAFDFLPATKEYGWENPDKDTVIQMFNDVFDTQDEDIYEKPMTYFEQLVQERFGMGIDELYALPIK